MVMYIVLAIFLMSIFFLRNTYVYYNAISREFILMISFVILFVLYILRNVTVGKDYLMYYSFFGMPSFELKSHFIEKGYIILNQFAQNENEFIIISIVIFLTIFYGLYSLSNRFNFNKFSFLFFFVITYFYFFTFNALRQFWALGIICIGLNLFFKFYNTKWIKYIIALIIIIFAKYFHSSALFCLLFLFLPKIKFGKKGVFILGFITTFLYFTNIFNNLFNKLLLFFPNYLQKYGNKSISLNKGYVAFIPVIIQFIYIFIFIDKNNLIKSRYRFIVEGYLFFLVLYSFSGNLIGDRLQTYTYIFPVLFSSFIFSTNNKINLNVSALFKYSYIVFWILYYILRLITNNSGVVPYSMI